MVNILCQPLVNYFSYKQKILLTSEKYSLCFKIKTLVECIERKHSQCSTVLTLSGMDGYIFLTKNDLRRGACEQAPRHLSSCLRTISILPAKWIWSNAPSQPKQKDTEMVSFCFGCPSQPLFERRVMTGYKSLCHKALSHFL